MMSNTLQGSAQYERIAFVDRGNQPRVEADRPYAIVRVLELDVPINYGIGDVEQSVPKATCPRWARAAGCAFSAV